MASFKLRILAPNPELGIRAVGLKFAFFFSVVLFAAVNTGNNLTYLIFSALCGAVITSWTLSWMSMRSLEVKLRLPNEAYAGEETRIDFLVSKGRALLPARSLAFSLRPAPSAEGTHQPYALRIAQGESRRISGLYRFHERGKYRIAGVDVRCGHPFGIISLSRRFRLEHEMLIYPRIMPIEEMFERRKEGLALRDAQLRGHGGGLLNVRPFVPGDDYRRLHWKASAKLERMMLKEFAHEEGQAIWLHFNPMRRSAPAAGDGEIFELAVSVAASVAYHGRRLGLRILLSAPGLRLAPGRQGDYVRFFLDYLSEVQIGPLVSTGETALIPNRRGDETALVIDPLNINTHWVGGAEVLDRRYFEELLHVVRGPEVGSGRR